jgi:uncharacterized protein YceH (UPF0502 family)
MATVGGVGDVEAALQALMDHGAGPFVARLPRSPGHRDVRYAHLLGGEVAGAAAAPATEARSHPVTPGPAAVAVPPAELASRVERLEEQVADLLREVAALRGRLDAR